MLRARALGSRSLSYKRSTRAQKRYVSTRTDMLCYQCEQTKSGTGCSTVGVCGKTPETAALQDLLVHAVKGIAMYTKRAYDLDKTRDHAIDSFVIESLFATMTNVNFDSSRFVDRLHESTKHMEKAKNLYEQSAAGKGVKSQDLTSRDPLNPVLLKFDKSQNVDELSTLARQFGLLEARSKLDPDLLGVRELIMYGLKGTAAYACHAGRMAGIPDEVNSGIHEALEFVGRNSSTAVDTLDDALGMALKVGAVNYKAMEALERNHTMKFGVQSPHDVLKTPVEGKCILVSGHDIQDIADLLLQTQGTGVNVYTHGEMLPAHAYPKLRQYKHFAGHWGRAWQKQRRDFGRFPGPIIITTNCLIEPDPSYKDRIFTRTVTGWPGVKHLATDDYSEVIKLAKELPGFTETVSPAKTITVGYGKDAILSKASAVLDAIKAGQLKQFFVIGGCDGTESDRSYFTDLAKAAPQESLILTMGCGKFRLNSNDFGTLQGIPRLLDMGQCNDAYGAVQVALELSKALNVGVNDLPINYAISWFEQKAVAVLLTLLHLNVQGIHLGPRIPAFCTPNMLKLLKEKYKLVGTGDYKEDFKDALA